MKGGIKSVLFHYPVLNMGGAEKSTLRMIRALCDRGWKVTLVLTTGGGELEPEIDPRVTVVRLRPRAFGQRFVEARGPVARLCALPDLIGYGAMRFVGGLRMAMFLLRHYDAAAVGIHSTNSVFVRRVVRTNTRVHWIRNDISGVDPKSILSERLRKSDAGIDHYVCVSRIARNSLVGRMPEAREKATVIYNILDASDIRKKMQIRTEKTEILKDEATNIVTVCRLLDRDKALFRLVRVARTLKDDGLMFRWYVVGDGPDRCALAAQVATAGLADTVILLGPKKNPFPYYREADLIAMVSYHEGLSGMINEAKVCGKSVFATNLSGVDEQITDSINGWVVENDEASIVTGLRRLLKNPSLIRSTANHLYPEEIISDEKKLDCLEAILLGQNRQERCEDVRLHSADKK